MLLISLYYYVKVSRIRDAGNKVGFIQWIVLGVVLGFTVLSRIDAVFLVIAIAFYEFYRFKGKGFVNGAIISLTAFIISSPWWYYNYKVFGSLMPQSGVSESLETGVLLENLRRGAIVLGDIFTVFFFLPNYELPIWFHFVWLAAVLSIVFWVIRKFNLGKYLRNTCTLSTLPPYFFFCGVLVIYYIFFFSAPHFLPRYFQPFRILWLAIFACVAPEIIQMLRNLYERKKNIVFVSISIFALAALTFSASRYIYYFVIERTSEFYLTGKWALIIPHVRIGMEQSGTAGFVAPNIVNLDGKVNFVALQAKRNNDIGSYIESEKLDYIADWRQFAEPLIASAEKHGGKFREIDSIARIIIFKRVMN
jgi:hypothetical protein